MAVGRGSVTIVLRWYGMQESEHPVALEHLSVTSVDSKCYAIDWLMLEKSSPTLIPSLFQITRRTTHGDLRP